MIKYSIFIFRRDLRLRDNKGLDFAIKNYENILPIFIFTPEQITNKNKYKSNNAIQFMCESLKELDDNLQEISSKLHIFNGDNIKILNEELQNENMKLYSYYINYTSKMLRKRIYQPMME